MVGKNRSKSPKQRLCTGIWLKKPTVVGFNRSWSFEAIDINKGCFLQDFPSIWPYTLLYMPAMIIQLYIYIYISLCTYVPHKIVVLWTVVDGCHQIENFSAFLGYVFDELGWGFAKKIRLKKRTGGKTAVQSQLRKEKKRTRSKAFKKRQKSVQKAFYTVR